MPRPERNKNNALRASLDPNLPKYAALKPGLPLKVRLAELLWKRTRPVLTGVENTLSFYELPSQLQLQIKTEADKIIKMFGDEFKKKASEKKNASTES